MNQGPLVIRKTVGGLAGILGVALTMMLLYIVCEALKGSTNYLALSALADDFEENSHHIGPVDKIVVNNYEFGGEKNPQKAHGYLRTAEMAGIVDAFLGDRRYDPFSWLKKIIPGERNRTAVF